MQEVLPRSPDTQTEPKQIPLNMVRDRKRASLLKFYIHDSAAYFRIELVGELSEVDIAELTGCWCTARSSVIGRKLALDIRHLKATDEAGLQWLASMVREGACYITGKDRSGAYLTCLDWRSSNPTDRHNTAPKILRALRRIFSLMRQWVGGADGPSQTNTVNADSVRATGL